MAFPTQPFSITPKTPRLLLDGGLATELERRGFDLNDPLWSAKVVLTDPAAIIAVHYNYLCAGAQVITTASYQASVTGFCRAGCSPGQARAALRTTVTLARSACRQWQEAGGSTISLSEAERQSLPASLAARPLPWVAASVGPYGAYLADGSEYRGHYSISHAALRAFHAERLVHLAEAEPDLLAIETIPCRAEAAVVVELLEQFPHLSAWVSFCCNSTDSNAQGEPIQPCVQAVATHPQVVAVGLNCTPPAWVVPLVQQIRAVTTKPIVVYPNRGEAFDSVEKCWLPNATSVEWHGEQAALDWLAAGASWVGGCCRVGVSEIHQLAVILQSNSNPIG